MATKKKNERCPLQPECEKVCQFSYHEQDCEYYQGNARPGAEIEGLAAVSEKELDERLLAEMAADEPGGAEPGKMVYIPTGRLSPHPDNPRKDLGDLQELSDSIKENGVLQNLTVVRRFGEITGEPLDCFTVIIGHRRLAAVKLAGLKELPCVIVEMTLQDQVRTMLMENIQRADLTVYEQAQGFQLMLNLGDSVDVIARKSGFSQTTVRRRVKLLELDQDKFKASVGRGATLQDYMELDKIKDTNRKNKVLEAIGTDNFKFELKKAIDAEASEERKARWIEAMSAFATQVDSDSGYAQAGYFSTYNEPSIERPEDADEVDYFFVVEKYGAIRLLKKPSANSKPEKSAEEAEREKREKKLRGQLEEITKRAYELRKEFAESVSTTCAKKHLAEILAFDLWVQMGKYCSVDDDEILEALAIELHEAEGDDDEDEDLTYDMVLSAAAKSPEKVLWRIAYCNMDDDGNEGYFDRWQLVHKKNDCLDHLYALLVKMGYQMSDEEKAMQDGTHELFRKEPDADNQ